MPHIAQRTISSVALQNLNQQGIAPFLARLYAGRGIEHTDSLRYELQHLLPFTQLKNCTQMAEKLADAIADKQRICIVADYDADGATACTVGVLGLRSMGAKVDFLVPNRFKNGYGLTPEVVDIALSLTPRPDILLTVDNGISSVEGVAYAHEKGLEVLITDHHLAGGVLPDTLIVNPNQPDCSFPSKNLAGVGVMFYVLMALRSTLRERGAFDTPPNLAQLLDLVALGTVADVVKLDDNNRILVQQGLRRVRAGQARAGIRALFSIAKTEVSRATAMDFGFKIGPRLNAAGRLDDMRTGILCLLSDAPKEAECLANELDCMNQERKQIETDMQESAAKILDGLDLPNAFGVSLYQADWHQGVIGILASRVKDMLHRPVMVFADGHAGEMKASGRSIPALHLRDALDVMSKRHPDLILKFGGHSAAAGLTIRQQDFGLFQEAFDLVVQQNLSPADLTQTLETDGELQGHDITLENALSLENEVWGQNFPYPTFTGQFQVISQTVMGQEKNHRRLRLATQDGVVVEAVCFKQVKPLPDSIQAVYKLQCNHYNNQSKLQVLIDYWEVA